MTIKRQHMASQLNAYEMASRSRPSSPRYKLPAPSRRLWLILSLSLVLLLLVSIDACGSVFRRANSLGRRCSPPVADSDKAGAGLKVAIVSFSEESRRGSRRRSFQGLMEMVRGNKKAYADKKGYHFVDASNMIDKRRPASWSKIIAVKALLPYYDWVFWNDADTLVTNSTISLENILQAVTGTTDFNSSPDLVLTEDFTGVNAGLFFVRRSKWSVDFLNTWWNQTAFVRFGSSKSGDNDALKHLIKQLPPDELRNHVRIPPMQCIFNSYPWIPTWKTALRLFSSPSTIWNGAYSYGDFMVHLAGLDEKTRWAAEILRELEED
ncbi:hypothetical protein AAC387_Pa02g0506 [Persea americana]